MEYIVTIPDFGKKREPKDADLLYKISHEFYDKKTLNAFKQIFAKRPEYAWLLSKEENLLNETEIREKKMSNIVKGVCFTRTEKGMLPVNHYKYIMTSKHVAYIDFMTSFLLKKGIATHLLPKIIEQMKRRGVTKIKGVPYSKSNHDVFMKKFGFKQEGEFLVKYV